MKLVSVFLLLMVSPVLAENSDVPVRQLTGSGLHFEAVLAAQEKDTLSLEERLSAARSAWALGLAETARKNWDEALANESFDGTERDKELLARAILELQEGRLEQARSLAEKTAATIPASDLRAQFWLLIAESLRTQGALSQAESYYQRAVSESSQDTRSEANYLLGECLLRLGRMTDARYAFAGVESKGRFAVAALKRLVEIDLDQKSYEGVLTWIHEGRENYPSEFEDPWVSYAQTMALLEVGRIDDASQELKRMKTRHSENETWYQLADSSMEANLLRASLTTPVPDKSKGGESHE